MAVHKSVLKRARQNTTARQRNRSWKSKIKTQQKKIEKAIENNKAEEVEDLYREFCSLVDRVASKRIIHRNNASRKKTRVWHRIKSASTPSEASTTEKVKTTDKSAAARKPKASGKPQASGEVAAAEKPRASKKVSASKKGTSTGKTKTSRKKQTSGKPSSSKEAKAPKEAKASKEA